MLVGETDCCTRSTASAARTLAWSTSPSGAVDPNTVYVTTPLFKTSSTTSHVPGKRPWILAPGFGTACTHRISDESGVINTMQTFGSGDTAYGILSQATRKYSTRLSLSLPKPPDAFSASSSCYVSEGTPTCVSSRASAVPAEARLPAQVQRSLCARHRPSAVIEPATSGRRAAVGEQSPPARTGLDHRGSTPLLDRRGGGEAAEYGSSPQKR